VYEKVLEGTVDFGLVSFPRKTRELAVEPWRDEEMVFVCRPDHPLAKRKTVPPALLGGEKYVGFGKGLTIRREVDRFLREQGVTVGVMVEFDDIENIKKGVEVGAGVALLPAPTLRQEVKAGTLAARPLEGCRFVRPLGIVYRRHHKPGGAARRFLELLRQAGGSPSAHHNGAAGANGRPRVSARAR
jgi:DNA-binding transcriptional LysR family regulator